MLDNTSVENSTAVVNTPIITPDLTLPVLHTITLRSPSATPGRTLPTSRVPAQFSPGPV